MPSHASVEEQCPVGIFRTASDNMSVRVDWSRYATTYDLLSEYNPEYQALLHDFEAFLHTIKTPLLIYDIGGGTVNYNTLAIEDIDSPGTADLVICVHALYAMPAPEQRLGELRRLLRVGGFLYLVDLGRYMDVADWRSYLFSILRKELGLIGALRMVWQGREIAKQNKTILRAQKKGVYWTHTGAELASAATAAGFEILRQQSVYRGYSDLLVCRAKP